MKLPRASCRGAERRSALGTTNASAPRSGSACRPPTEPAQAVPAGSKSGSRSNAVLLIVPDPEIRGLLRFGLKQQGFDLLEAGTVRQAIELTAKASPGVLVLDMDATGPDGILALQTLRQSSRAPVLALAGRISRIGAVEALDGGATDFIARPFDIEELGARLRAVRRDAPAPGPEVFQSGSLIVDLTRRIVQVGERIVNLSATEYTLLHLFIRHAGSVLTHAQILREVWGTEMLEKVGYLRVYLLALRKKLEIPSEPALFLTERAVGYRLVVREG